MNLSNKPLLSLLSIGGAGGFDGNLPHWDHGRPLCALS